MFLRPSFCNRYGNFKKRTSGFFFRRLQELSLETLYVDDVLDKLFDMLPSLKRLELPRCFITSECLKNIWKLANLKHLEFRYGSFQSNTSISYLTQLTSLHTLVLSGAQIQDSSIQYLTQLTQLTHLELRCPSITDAAVVHLMKLRSLKSLNVTHTRITHAAIQQLWELPSLAVLSCLHITESSLRPSS